VHPQNDPESPANPPRHGFELSVEVLAQCLSEYEVIREVGSGAMGVVYEATHKPLQRRVALKVLPPGLAAREATITRFLREAEVIARVHHENIVPIYDVGSREGLHYIAMRFVPGVSLDRAVAAAPLSPDDVAKIGLQVARALACAHGTGIVHRDVKPGNLLREPDGRVSLTDFGLARADGSGTMTESGALVGTPNYMSPEQVAGNRDSIDGRTDLYSLGASMYELLAGRPPFLEATTSATLRSILDKTPPRLRKLRPDVPDGLEIVIDKAMRKEPAARYPNATAMAEDLERFLKGQPVVARREPVVRRAMRYVGAHRGVFIAGTLAGVAGLSFLAVTLVAKASSDEKKLSDARAAMEEASPNSPGPTERALMLLEEAHQSRRTMMRACPSFDLTISGESSWTRKPYAFARSTTNCGRTWPPG